MKNTTMLAGARRGYVLVSVLVLSLIASMVVFVSIRENQLQERMSGNQQKMINARLAAERGIAAALDHIKTQMASGTDINSIATGGSLLALRGTPDNYRLSDVAYVSADKRLSLLSTGHDLNNDATAQLNARFIMSAGVAGQGNGVIGCQSLTVRSGAYIDSYDSAHGKYDINTNRGENASVALVNAGSATELVYTERIPSGFPLIGGNFTAYNGNVESKKENNGPSTSVYVSGDLVAKNGVILNTGSVVKGNIVSGGDVKLNAGSFVNKDIKSGGGLIINANSTVDGSVYAESVLLNDKDAIIKGDVVSNGDFTMNNSNQINGKVSANTAMIKGKIVGDVRVAAGSIQNNGATVGGEIEVNSKNRPLSVSPTIPDAGELKNICNQNKNTNQWIRDKLGSLPSDSQGDLIRDNCDCNSFSNYNNKKVAKLDISGESNNNRRIIEVNENTTLYVTGEVKLVNLTIKVKDGKSLTIKQSSQWGGIDINDVNVVNQNSQPVGAGNSGVAPLAIYSNTGARINLRATKNTDNSFYSAIYAPFAELQARDSAGDIYGSILAKNVNLENSAGFHYDEGLGNGGGGASSSTIKLTSILDYFPDQAVQLPEEEE